jgi:hypothetical protein
VIRREPKPKRVSLGWRPDPDHIFAFRDAKGTAMRVVRWVDSAGRQYMLGYQKLPRVFGERQRFMRERLMASVRMTILCQELRDAA